MERGGGEEKSSEKHAVPRGYVPVLVGSEKEMERFLLRVELFKHPSIMVLLEVAAQEFGYNQKGILKIPCDVKHFKVVLDQVLSKRTV